MEDQERLAFIFAKSAHMGQFRRDGVTPYINHPISVASKLEDSDKIVVALLHDVLEDTDKTEKDLREVGFSDKVIAAVKVLTKVDDGISYMEYLTGVKENELARSVKIADMISNLEDDPSEYQIKKYARGLSFLIDER